MRTAVKPGPIYHFSYNYIYFARFFLLSQTTCYTRLCPNCLNETKRVTAMQNEQYELDNIDMKLNFGGAVLNILYLRFASPSRIRHIGNHCHSGYELHFIPYGRGRLITSGVVRPIVPGSLYLTGPNVYHEQIGDPDNPMAEYCINFEIQRGGNLTPTRVSDDMRRIFHVLSTTSFWFGTDHYGCLELFRRLLAEINSRRIGYMENIASYTAVIIRNAIRCFSGDAVSRSAPPAKDINDRRRLIVDSYIQDRWSSRSVRELADRLGVSVRQVDRICRQYYGCSFHHRMMHVRMQNAAALLMEPGRSVRSVAESVGFTDFSYFCRMFRREFSVTPTEYRKRSCQDMAL